VKVNNKGETVLKRFFLPLGLAAVVLVLAVAGTALSATEREQVQLQGQVYANAAFKIDMKTATGRSLKALKAGTYRIKIEDRATAHNFHLTGPGVNKATSIPGRVQTIWTVRLRPGTYTFDCDPHATLMHGSFRVT
jgi:plastocyanin